MSKFSFAQDVNGLKYLPTNYLDFLCSKHNISIEEAIDTMRKIGFEKGLTEEIEEENE